MKKPVFANNEIYHVYNRGVEKRNIFLDNSDYFRFIHDLYEFNDEEPAENLYYKITALKSYEVEPHKISKSQKETRKRKLLVEIVAYCLMSNHFHLLMRQKAENGIVRFMQKLGGYTMYFNQKHDRVGGLFQGRFKAVLLENQKHLMYLPHYIHLNPLDIKLPTWKNKKNVNTKKVIEFLDSYRWSSYLDFIGKKNFPSIISHNLFEELFESPKEYKKSLTEWLKSLEIDEIKEMTLEN